MNADGSNIHQISFNTNHDFAPSVLANGQIVFSRYESINGDQISLYRVQSGRHGSRALLRREQPCHGCRHRRHQRQRDPVPECAAAQLDGKLIAIVRPLHRARSRAATSCRSTPKTSSKSHQPAVPRRRQPGTGADQRHHARRHDGHGQAFAGRPICLGLSAVRRHQSHAGELGAVPGAGYDRPATTSVCTTEQHQRRERATWRRRSTPSGSTTSTRAP